ncbi:MAG: bifunctional DNA-formamidopyrimidine glycosylase/DNA-(apurinic or apyrimidinic site) lyase [Planctomycetes bacterium]|nr:bifunctional DNA-formamidopyrimidine glycosylase/DNA-(apurinic or apyrimidinic site) lyase [Planctomycetota bacterium]
MPELPEVQTIVTTLQPLVGRCVGTVRVLRGDIVRGEAVDFNTFAKGRKIRAIRRHAKRIIFDLGDERRIQFHLGMTGQLTVCKRSHPLPPHTHLRIGIAGTKDELRFRDVRRFGGVWLLNNSQVGDQGAAGFPSAPWDSRGLGPLGPDALEITLREFRRLLHRNRQVKALLLDQTAIGGLGNIYVDESLYKARVHPLTRAAELGGEQVKKLHGAMRRTLHSAIRAGGSTIRDYRTPNGERGWFQTRHQVYGREGQPCRRCKAPIERIQAAGRSSHICPNCQQIEK